MRVLIVLLILPAHAVGLCFWLAMLPVMGVRIWRHGPPDLAD